MEQLLEIGADLLQIVVALNITNRDNTYYITDWCKVITNWAVLSNRGRFITSRGNYYKSVPNNLPFK